MIPILYSSSETAFISQGLGFLTDAIRCEVTEERNGAYELVLEYPVSGRLATQLQPGNIIYCTHDDNQDSQPFQIYRVIQPIEGRITVNAWHISYALNSVVVAPFTANSCAAALAAIPTNSLNTNSFTFWTDKSVSGPYKTEIPMTARSILGGQEGSILDVYGKGEYEFDMFQVKLHTNRGSNNGVQIRYGKNLRSLDKTIDGSNVYNAVAPYWESDEDTVTLDHLVVKTGETAGNAIPLDMSDDFITAPSTAALEAAAQAYIDGTIDYEVKDNIKISFVPLWQTEEYKYLESLERVKLCDTVNIIYERLGINATAKVIRVVYDTLRDRYLSMELGEPTTTLAQQIQTDTAQSLLPKILTKQEAYQGIVTQSITTVGDATFGGGATVSGQLRVQNNTIRIDSNATSGLIIAYPTNDNIGYVQLIAQRSATAGVARANRFYVVNASYDATTGEATTGNETYRFPTVSPGLTATTNYNVHTTKTYQNTQTLVTTIASGTSRSFTVSNGAWGWVGISGSGATYQGLSSFNATNAGAMTVTAIRTASGCTITSSTNTLTISNTGSNQAKIAIVMFVGTVS